MSQYMALYRKWRPAKFADVVGQEHITRVLRSEIMQDSVSHAYLFCGSRGTGKTTCAKILAKAVSCENPVNGDPCGECEKCRSFESSFDIVEMDAASNNGVNDIRELKEKISFMPVEMKRRVYIVDEVHMLSPGAFNALLKTLEEPPEHVMFILATTELNKIPATILSRCKRFDFRRISIEDITKRLEYISQEENIGIEKDALRLIASLATGAMRDALSMLELFVGQNGITRKQAESSLGVVGSDAVLKLLSQIGERDASSALGTIYESYNSSKDLSVLCSELGNMFRNLLIMKYASNSVTTLIDEGEDVINTLRNVEELYTPERLLYCTEIVENAAAKLSKNGLSRRTVLEIMVMRLCDSRLTTSNEAILERLSSLESLPRSTAIPAATSASSERAVGTAFETPSEKASATVSEKAENAGIPDDVPPFDLDNLPTPPPAFDDPYFSQAPAAPQKASSGTGIKKSESAAKQEGSAKAAPSGRKPCLAFGEILQDLRATAPSICGFLVDAEAYLEEGGGVLTVVTTSMAVLMASASPNKEALAASVKKILGYDIKVNVISDSGQASNSFDDFPLFS